MGAALAFALHIVVLGEVAERHDPVRLTLWQVLTVAAACSVPGLVAPGGYRFDGGVWLAMKGKHPEDEIAALPPGVGVFHVEQLAVPGLDADRCIVWLRRVVPGVT